MGKGAFRSTTKSMGVEWGLRCHPGSKNDGPHFVSDFSNSNIVCVFVNNNKGYCNYP